MARPREAAPALIGLAMLGAMIPLRSVWAAGVVAFALSLTVPGVLALRALRVPRAAVQLYPLFVPTSSLLVMLAAGLLADLVGPLFGIAAPLHGATAGLTTIGLSLGLWVLGIRAPLAARCKWQTALSHPEWLAPLALPVVSGAGALLLSHGDGPTVARVGQALVALSLMAGLALAPRLQRGQLAMLLYGCALAAEWAFSLRSREVIGFDISSEVGIAQRTQVAGIWHTLHYGDPYGAMLSLTVLPSALASLTGCSPLIAFKVGYPALTALLPVSVFLVGERFMRRGFAAGAASLLIVQTYFFELMPQLARQEIGLVLFAALAAALLADGIPRRPRLSLVTLLSLGVVVSHYSSTYMTVPMVVLSLLLTLAIVRWRAVRPLLAPLLCAWVALAGGAAIWYGVVTHSSQNLSSFVTRLERQGLDLIPNRSSNIVATYLHGTETVSVTGPAFERLAVAAYRSRFRYIHPLATARLPRYGLRTATVPEPPPRLHGLATALGWLAVVFNELMLVLGVLGALAMVARRRAPPIVAQAGILALSTLAVLVLIRFSGTIAAAYNQPRALAQSLILLALPAAWLTQRIFDRLGPLRRTAALVLAAGFGVMFTYQTSLTAVLTGGGTLLNLSQSGEDFERLYMTPAELAGAAWASHQSRGSLLYADRYGQLRLWASTGANALLEVTPETLDRHAWLYGTRTNVVLGRGRGEVGDHLATYAWPDAFLNRYFDTVFTDGDSKVYHR